MESNFQRIVKFNEAIGNESGSIKWENLEKEADMIQSELNELRLAIAAKDLDGVRDALCDIHVFAYGTHHKLGIDADVDMHKVTEALYTRFCRSQIELMRTIAHHRKKGVIEVFIHGEFPWKYIKSAGDYPDAPKGKFLKSVEYKEPIFDPVE